MIVKHANPCGVSILKNKIKSYKSALACDPVSAFGGIVSCNFKIDKTLAIELNKVFFEVIIADGFNNDALQLLKLKKNLRIIDASNFQMSEILKINSQDESFLIQFDDKKKFTKKRF